MGMKLREGMNIMGQEIERKYLIRNMPDLSLYESKKLMQGYLCTDPTVRVRKEDDEYYMTYKRKGGDNPAAKEEYNLFLSKEAFEKLIKKSDGNIISKTRYLIPIGTSSRGNNLVAELDVFDAPFAPLKFIEVEFQSISEMNEFIPPEWFGEDVTDNPDYYNSNMSKKEFA